MARRHNSWLPRLIRCNLFPGNQSRLINDESQDSMWELEELGKKLAEVIRKIADPYARTHGFTATAV